ncbi:MAG: collagen-binding domain-containing protein [Chordicoccus sp.]
MIRKNIIAVGLAAFLAAGSLIPACSGSVSADNVQSSAVQSADTEQTDTGQTQDAAADPGGKGSETSADTGAAEASEAAGASADNAAADPAAGSEGNGQNAAGDAQNASGSGQNEAETAGEQTGNGTVTTDASGQRILTFSYEDDQMYVTASFSDPNAISDQAELTVTPVTADTEGYNYEAYMQALNDSVGNEISPKGGSYNETNTALYDIAFLMKKRDADGNIIKDDYYEVEPDAGTCTVTMTMKQAQFTKGLGASDENLKIVHLPISENVRSAYETTEEATGIQASDVQTEAVPDRDVELDQGGQDKVAFQMNSFSVIGVVDGGDGTVPSSDDKFAESNYTLTYILNHYNVFIRNDAKTLTHTNGSIVVGGTLTNVSNWYGLNGVAGVPSYIGNIADTNNLLKPDTNNNDVVTYVGNEATYNAYQSNSEIDHSKAQFFVDAGFIDFDKAFTALSKQSEALLTEDSSARVITADDSGFNGTTLTIKAGERVILSKGAIEKLGSWGSIHIDTSETGIQSTRSTVITYDTDGEVTLPTAYIGSGSSWTQLGSLGEADLTNGCSLVWNLPHVTKVNTNPTGSPFAGHVVAPNATIHVGGGNFSGCLLGKELDSNSAEGHMMPYEGEELVPASNALGAKKTVNGEAPAADQVFSFDLSELTGSSWGTIQTKQNSGTEVAFDSISYSKAGTYWYRIREASGSDAGMLYDSSVYMAKVVVSSSTSGTTTTCKISSITYYKADSSKDGADAIINGGSLTDDMLTNAVTSGLLTKADSASFNNKLDSLVIRKTFDDSALTTKLTDDQKKAVTFTVTGPDSYSQTFTYGDMTNGTYTIEGLKEGTYTVTETVPGIDGAALTSTWTVKTAGSDGTESGNTSGSGTTASGAALVSGGSAEVAFTNTYAPAKGGLRITKEVTVNGQATKSTAADGTYCFTVKNADGKYVKDQTTGAVQDSEQQFSITIANGVSSSLDITGLAPGTYTIQELTGSLPTGMTLTKINGADAGGGNTATVTVKANNTSDLSAATAVFTNNKTVVVNMPETGSTSALRVMLTGFGLLAAGMLIMIIFRRKEDMRKRR